MIPFRPRLRWLRLVASHSIIIKKNFQRRPRDASVFFISLENQQVSFDLSGKPDKQQYE